jgi:hypothetical protein
MNVTRECVLAGVVVGLLGGFSLAGPVLAQGSSRVIAEGKWRPPTDLTPASADEDTSADRWLRFESEYGIHRRESTAVGRILRRAKYGLDTMTFTAQEAARRLEFTYDLGEPALTGPASTAVKPQYSLPLFGSFGHAQIKSVLTQHDAQTGTAFLGLKLSIQFGTGS